MVFKPHSRSIYRGESYLSGYYARRRPRQSDPWGNKLLLSESTAMNKKVLRGDSPDAFCHFVRGAEVAKEQNEAHTILM